MTSSCCSIGGRPDHEAIDDALRAGEGVRSIVKRTGAPKTSLLRHRNECLGLGAPKVDASASAPPTSHPVQKSGPPADRAESPRPKASGPTEEPRGNGGIASARKLATAELEERCWDLRKRGFTYDQVSAELGVPFSTVRDATVRVLNRKREHTSEAAEEHRAIQVDQCLAIIKSLYDRATDPAMATVDVPADTETGTRAYDGQDKAADRFLKTMDRLSKLLGLDAPVKQETTVLVQLSNGQSLPIPATDIMAGVYRGANLLPEEMRALFWSGFGGEEPSGIVVREKA